MLLKFGKRENVTFSPLVGNLRRNEKSYYSKLSKRGVVNRHPLPVSVQICASIKKEVCADLCGIKKESVNVRVYAR